MKNIKRIFFSAISLTLIAVMLLLATACVSEQSSENDADAGTDEPKTIEVPVFTEDIEFGKKITTDKVTTVTISKADPAYTVPTAAPSISCS